MRHADYQIVKITDKIIFIQDLNLGNISVTNDAEWVVENILNQYNPPKRIVYRDSEGQWDELVHDGRRFVAFGPWNDEVPVAA